MSVSHTKEDEMKQMKRLRRWLTVALLLLPLLLTAGCGNGSNPGLGAPTGVTATGSTSQTTLSWSAVSGATSYNVYYGATTGVTKATATNSVTGVAATTTTVPSLLNGTTYYFIVTAVNDGGESTPSSEASTTPLAAPRGITVTAGDAQVTVEWSAVTGATSYNIYYGTTAGVSTATGTLVANGVTPQVITGLTNGTPYYFVVTAVNASGESQVSSDKSAPPAAAPQPTASPTGVVVASTVAGQAAVTWNAVTGATSYKVYYLQSNTTPTHAAIMAGSALSGNSANLTVPNLTSGAKYYFLVTALNGAGESGTQNSAKSVTVL